MVHVGSTLGGKRPAGVVGTVGYTAGGSNFVGNLGVDIHHTAVAEILGVAFFVDDFVARREIVRHLGIPVGFAVDNPGFPDPQLG